MSGGFSLGRIAGIQIRVDWSLLVIFGLIATSLATSVFPDAVPGQPAWVRWAIAVVTAALFFASLLAHEVAHSVVARRHSVAVEGITLWLLGGVSRLRGDVRTPGDEARITAIGPAVSFLLALLFWGAAWGLQTAGVPDAVVAAPLWLALMNLLLAAFNLVPALPLDGGRILHAILWRRGRDRTRATASAARVGRGFGYLLIAGGVFEFFAYAALGGVWFVIVGWFLVTAARAEETQTRYASALEGIRVRDVMSPDPVVIPDWVTVDTFLHDYVLAHRVSCFPVRGVAGELTGVVSVRRLGAVPRTQRDSVRVGAVATPLDRVPRGAPDEPVVDVMRRMQESADGRVLVFDGHRLVGIVSPSDIARAVQVAGPGDHRRAA